MYQEAIDLAAESKIAIFCGHGSPTAFQISYKYESPTRTLSSKKKGVLYNTDMFSSAANVDFSNIDIIIFAGCQTAGNPTTYFNLAESAHKAGAKVAIGWTATTGSDLFRWMDAFFKALNSGKTASGAKIDADDAAYSDSSRTSVLYGNGAYKFS
jgi:CHAT domain-containing protein